MYGPCCWRVTVQSHEESNLWEGDERESVEEVERKSKIFKTSRAHPSFPPKPYFLAFIYDSLFVIRQANNEIHECHAGHAVTGGGIRQRVTSNTTYGSARRSRGASLNFCDAKTKRTTSCAMTLRHTATALAPDRAQNSLHIILHFSLQFQPFHIFWEGGVESSSCSTPFSSNWLLSSVSCTCTAVCSPLRHACAILFPRTCPGRASPRYHSRGKPP